MLMLSPRVRGFALAMLRPGILALLVVLAVSGRSLADGKPTIAVVEIEGKLASRAKVLSPLAPAGPATMARVTDAIAGVGQDREAVGLLIRLREAELSLGEAEEIGRAVRAIRDQGKKVYLYAYSLGTPDLVLGSFADEVIVQAGGAVSLPGLYAEEIYLADALSWVGVRADMVQVGDYKGAAEELVNSKPSAEWSQNIDALLDSIYARVRAQLKQGRKLDDAGLDRAMETAWSATAEDARRVGLVDTVLDLPDLTAHLEKAHGEFAWGDNLLDAEERAPDVSNPFAIIRALLEKPDYGPARPTIAVLHIDGAIVDGESTEGGILGGEGSVGSLTIRRALSEIERDDLIKGVIVRIDSPGGSAIASEVIWQGLRRVAEKGKPVWASVGGMAASGGYYVAVGAGKIYVTPASIVGSIGVVGGKMATEGLFKTLRLNVVSRARGPRADMESSAPWSDEQRGLVRAKMKETYDLFASRVAAGRKGIDLSKTAEGRLFTGERAIDLKMADALGGLDDAVGDLAMHMGLEVGDYDVMDYPAPMTLAEMLQSLMGTSGVSASAPRVGATAWGGLRQAAGAPGGSAAALDGLDALASEALGSARWRAIREPLRALMQLRREPVLLASPRIVFVR